MGDRYLINEEDDTNFIRTMHGYMTEMSPMDKSDFRSELMSLVRTYAMKPRTKNPEPSVDTTVPVKKEMEGFLQDNKGADVNEEQQINAMAAAFARGFLLADNEDEVMEIVKDSDDGIETPEVK